MQTAWRESQSESLFYDETMASSIQPRTAEEIVSTLDTHDLDFILQLQSVQRWLQTSPAQVINICLR
jgi:hypothetical protein